MRRRLGTVVVAIVVGGCGAPDARPAHPDPPATDSEPWTPEEWPTETVDTGTPVLDAASEATALVHGTHQLEYFGGGAALGDVTGDDEPDLLVYSADREGAGSSVFAGPLVGDIPSSAALVQLPGGGPGVGMGDFDGDGSRDLAVLRDEYDTDLEWHLYFGPVDPHAPPIEADAVLRHDRGGTWGTVCDANLDGVDDLTFWFNTGTLEIALGPLPPGPSGPDLISTVLAKAADGTGNPSMSYLCGADVTSDGAADLLVEEDGLVSTVWLIDDPSWGSTEQLSTAGEPLEAKAYGGALSHVGDPTHDGHADLLVGRNLLAGPITADAEPFAVFEWESVDRTNTLPVGDLDGDGIDDLVVADSGYPQFCGTLYVFLGPVTAGTYLPDHAVVRLSPNCNAGAAYLGTNMVAAGGLWGATAPLGGVWEEGQVYLFDYQSLQGTAPW